MKKTLLIAALTLAAAPAMASKARLAALNFAGHLEDIQDVFANPSKAANYGEWLTFEFGTTPSTNATAAADPKAEGGFSRAMGNANYGFYLGHHSTWITAARQAAYLAPDNTVNLFYGSKAGEMAWGAGLEYSNSNKKSTQQKQSALGLNGGVTMGHWDAALNVGLTNTYNNDATSTEFKGKTGFDLSGSYTMNTMTFTAAYGMNGSGKEDVAGTATHDTDISSMSLGVVNSHKKDGADFFYGAKYKMDTTKDKIPDNKTETTDLPVFAGIEADATSWMVLRASVQQNFLLGTTKVTTAGSGGEADTTANNTTVNAGAGLKFGKMTIDGTLTAAASNTAALDGNNFLANGSLTYKF